MTLPYGPTSAGWAQRFRRAGTKLYQCRKPAGQLRWVNRRASHLLIPALGAPDYDKGMHTGHHGLAFDSRVVAKRCWHKNTPLTVQVQIGGFREHEPPEGAAIGVCNRKRVDPLRQRDPGFHGIEGETRIDAAGQHQTVREIRAKAGWDCQTALG